LPAKDHVGKVGKFTLPIFSQDNEEIGGAMVADTGNAKVPPM
jgi:hypothetical protein